MLFKFNNNQVGLIELKVTDYVNYLHEKLSHEYYSDSTYAESGAHIRSEILFIEDGLMKDRIKYQAINTSGDLDRLNKSHISRYLEYIDKLYKVDNNECIDFVEAELLLKAVIYFSKNETKKEVDRIEESIHSVQHYLKTNEVKADDKVKMNHYLKKYIDHERDFTSNFSNSATEILNDLIDITRKLYKVTEYIKIKKG